MSGISTHVLDTSRGQPAAGVVVILEFRDSDGWRELSRGVTDTDGRISALLPGGTTTAGDFRLQFIVGDYFVRCGQPVFYPEVAIHVRLDASVGKYHLPLLLSSFGYSTYRGS